MTQERFNEIVEEECEGIKNVLAKKQVEYNLDIDRLSHFKKAAAVSGMTPEQVAYGYALKHWMSITDMIMSKQKYTKAAFNEKMRDLHNYLILIKGLLEDDNMFSDADPGKLTKPNFEKEVKYHGKLNEEKK